MWMNNTPFFIIKNMYDDFFLSFFWSLNRKKTCNNFLFISRHWYTSEFIAKHFYFFAMTFKQNVCGTKTTKRTLNLVFFSCNFLCLFKGLLLPNWNIVVNQWHLVNVVLSLVPFYLKILCPWCWFVVVFFLILIYFLCCFVVL